MMASRDYVPSESRADALHQGDAEPSASEEPICVRQSGEVMTDEEARHWFHRVADEAIAEGVTWARFSVHDDIPNLRIVEGWAKRPDDAGEIRWALQRPDGGEG